MVMLPGTGIPGPGSYERIDRADQATCNLVQGQANPRPA